MEVAHTQTQKGHDHGVECTFKPDQRPLKQTTKLSYAYTSGINVCPSDNFVGCWVPEDQTCFILSNKKQAGFVWVCVSKQPLGLVVSIHMFVKVPLPPQKHVHVYVP